MHAHIPTFTCTGLVQNMDSRLQRLTVCNVLAVSADRAPRPCATMAVNFCPLDLSSGSLLVLNSPNFDISSGQWQVKFDDDDEETLVRPGKLNSQFIVTIFSVLHAGGRSLFRFHISYSM